MASEVLTYSMASKMQIGAADFRTVNSVVLHVTYGNASKMQIGAVDFGTVNIVVLT